MKVEIDVRNEEVVEHVVMTLANRIDERFSDMLHERIEAVVEQRLTKLTDERLAAELDKALAEGWQLTDGYGRPTGEKLTLSKKVLGYLTKGSYHDPMDTIFREALDRAMKGEMGKLIEQATAKLREALDASIAEKLRKAVTDAVR